MIARISQGKRKASDIAAYPEYPFQSGIPTYRAIGSHKGPVFLSANRGECHHHPASFANPLLPLRLFVGADPEVAKYSSGDEKYLSEFEPLVTHYGVRVIRGERLAGVNYQIGIIVVLGDGFPFARVFVQRSGSRN
jgi:hypothetical protein